MLRMCLIFRFISFISHGGRNERVLGWWMPSAYVYGVLSCARHVLCAWIGRPTSWMCHKRSHIATSTLNFTPICTRTQSIRNQIKSNNKVWMSYGEREWAVCGKSWCLSELRQGAKRSGPRVYLWNQKKYIACIHDTYRHWQMLPHNSIPLISTLRT